MKEAVKRNPSILLDGLQWGAPGWIGNGSSFRRTTPITSSVSSRRPRRSTASRSTTRAFGTSGLTPERPLNGGWIKFLKAAFMAHGLATKLVAADEVAAFDVAEDMLKDPALLAAVDVLGNHYQSRNSESFEPAILDATGKPVWSSEDGPWRGDWEGAAELATALQPQLHRFGMTKTIIWSLVTSYADMSCRFPARASCGRASPGRGTTRSSRRFGRSRISPSSRSPGWVYLKNGCGFYGKIGHPASRPCDRPTETS